MSQYNPSSKSRIRQSPKKAKYDKETIYKILDDNLVGHVAFTDEDQTFVIPMLYGRENDNLYLHGASSSRFAVPSGKRITRGFSIGISNPRIS